MSSSMTSVKNWAKLSLIAAAVSMAVGCSNNDSDPLDQLRLDAEAAAKLAADAQAAAAAAAAQVAAIAASTPVNVFDGAATGCSVTTENPVHTAAEDKINLGVYNFAANIPNLTVATATGCTDADTGVKLALMKGVVKNQALIVSPISSLVVKAALASGATTVTETALATATAGVQTALGLPVEFNPVDPVSGNYAKSVVAEEGKVTTAQAAVSQVIQQKALAVATMMKAVEKASTSPAEAAAAFTEIAKNIAANPVVLDLKSETAVQAMLPTTLSVAVSASVATLVKEVADAPTAQAAAGVAKATATVLNDVATTVAQVVAVDTNAVTNPNAAPVELKNAVNAEDVKKAAAEKAQNEAAAAEIANAKAAAEAKAKADALAAAGGTGSVTP